MNYPLRFILCICFIVVLTSCQIFSRGKKNEEKTTSEKTEVTSTVPIGEKEDQPFIPASGVTANSMTRLEQNMLDEVNTLRTDPQGYINHVKAYMMEIRDNPGLSDLFKQQEIAAARELIAELSRMSPMLPLKQHMGLYQVAVAHGQDLQRQLSLNHIGSDGSYPWDRIRKQTDLSDGNENLVGGGRTVREAVLILLVDSGVPGRGHRLNLLDPQWEYLACHHINKVGNIDNCWVQLFGGKPKTAGQAAGTTNPPVTDISEITSETSIPKPYDDVPPPNRDINPVPVRILTTTTPTNTKIIDATSPASNQLKPSGSGEEFSFMNQEERDMIREINLMRSNPKGYIPYVRQYLQDFKTAGWDAATVDEELYTGGELIKQLEQLSPRSILKPDKALHRVAASHGADLQQMGKFQHTGSDGSHPWERVRAGTSMTDGNENLVGGLPTVRESVINLLIDAGIPDRGHRMTLMEPRWEYVACYKIGNIGEMPNCWVQVFGKQ